MYGKYGGNRENVNYNTGNSCSRIETFILISPISLYFPIHLYPFHYYGIKIIYQIQCDDFLSVCTFDTAATIPSHPIYRQIYCSLMYLPLYVLYMLCTVISINICSKPLTVEQVLFAHYNKCYAHLWESGTLFIPKCLQKEHVLGIWNHPCICSNHILHEIGQCQEPQIMQQDGQTRTLRFII